MQKILLPLFFFLIACALRAQTPAEASVFFETDRSELSPEARQSLDALALQLLAAPDYEVDIEAWTDDRGTPEYNQQLAVRRAEAVQQYLAAKGLQLSKSSVQSWGEQNQEYDNNTDEQRQLNRRVDVLIKPVFFSDYATFQTRLAGNTGQQVLNIEPDQDQTLTTRRGTTLVIPSNAFVFEDGSSPEGPVELELREAFSPADFIRHNLSTMSDGKILQTGGMLYIGASAGGRPLQLAEGAAITVALPTQQFDPEMELFYGEAGPGGSVNWKPVGQKFRQTIQSNKVTLDIDPSIGDRIMAAQVPVHPAPAVPSFPDRLGPEPRHPVAPYKPRAPQKPLWDNVQRLFGGGQGEAMSKKDSRKAEKYYHELLAKYERDSVNYVQLYERYVSNQEKYEKAVIKYREDRSTWVTELRRRDAAIREYGREEYLHRYSIALQQALKRVGKNIRRYEYYSNLRYAVHKTAAAICGNIPKERALRQGKRDFPTTNQLYDKYISHEAMRNRNRFSCNQYLPEYGDSGEAIRNMYAATGIQAIADSLDQEIKRRRILSVRTTDQADRAVRAYVTDVVRLGWINCDRFYNDPAEKIQLAVEESEEATMFVYCRDINSLLPFDRYDRGYIAPGLPKGKKVSVVAIKLKDGVPYFAMQDARVGDVPALKMNYRSTTMLALRTELDKLNI